MKTKRLILIPRGEGRIAGGFSHRYEVPIYPKSCRDDVQFLGKNVFNNVVLTGLIAVDYSTGG